MEQTSVQKLARVLRVMVIAVFVCNITVLFFVPGMALMRGLGELKELTSYENPLELPLRLLIIFAMCWSPDYWACAEDPYAAVLTLFLLSCGICTAIILWQGRRVLDTILKGNPFVLDNQKPEPGGGVLLRDLWGGAGADSLGACLLPRHPSGVYL